MWDIIIVGGGPAGLAAGLYSARAGMKAILYEHAFAGGQTATANVIENYPGFPSGIGGPELGEEMRKHAVSAGLEFQYADISSFDLSGDVKTVKLGDTSESARAVILCMGAKPRLLGVPGEDRFTGRGVSYCATCDGALFRDKAVAVIGGGDTAAEDALYLSRFASAVYVVHRRDTLRAAPYLAQRVLNNDRVTVLWDSAVLEIAGENMVSEISISNLKSEEVSSLPVAGVFAAVGMEPQTGLLDCLELDANGYVLSGETCETNIPGVFVAGDIRQKPLRQVVTAAADGAVAATQAFRYLAVRE